ncbi:MAG: LOG family protein [Patescibacteria group bacterium]|nr:LOG family protein [Patescibacteria group bacterium]
MNFYSPKYKICVSGAAETGHFKSDVLKIAEELGREIARHDCILVEGATTGFPFWSAKGAKEEGGTVIGFSPATSEKNHVEQYQLPLDYHDVIVYTGFDYSGRNLILTRAADAVIVGPGRLGTINEFTIAFEDKKPIGILEGDWETDDVLRLLIEKSHRADEMKDKIVFSSNPKEIVEKLLEIIKINKNHYYIS